MVTPGNKASTQPAGSQSSERIPSRRERKPRDMVVVDVRPDMTEEEIEDLAASISERLLKQAGHR